jgi:hypothetical protein
MICTPGIGIRIGVAAAFPHVMLRLLDRLNRRYRRGDACQVLLSLLRRRGTPSSNSSRGIELCETQINAPRSLPAYICLMLPSTRLQANEKLEQVCRERTFPASMP